MAKSAQYLVFALAIVATLGVAVVYGRWTNRWGQPTALLEAGKMLQALPHNFDNWEQRESSVLPPATLAILECDQYAQSVYVDRNTGRQIMCTLLVGPPGPMAVHTPEICYSAVDWKAIGERKRVTLDDKRPDTVWRSQFQDAHNSQESDIRVYYAWTDGNEWTAADEPRIQFGGRPFLFKVQVMERMPHDPEFQTSDPAKDFLTDFMPVFAQTVKSAHLISTD
jgi:hypothetical protein